MDNILVFYNSTTFYGQEHDDINDMLIKILIRD
jgi:hypothetical protein